MQFEKILKELILETNLSAKKLAKIIGIKNSSIYLYLKGSYPNVKNAVKLANYFNCTLNFLFGLDLYPNEYDFLKTYDLNDFFKKYTNLLKSKSISHYQVCKETGLNDSSYRLWKMGKEPRLESLIKISKFFNCTIDFLIGREDLHD